MDDMRAAVKELRRIADAGERIAKAMEKQNKLASPVINLAIKGGRDEDMIKHELKKEMTKADSEAVN